MRAAWMASGSTGVIAAASSLSVGGISIWAAKAGSSFGARQHLADGGDIIGVGAVRAVPATSSMISARQHLARFPAIEGVAVAAHQGGAVLRGCAAS